MSPRRMVVAVSLLLVLGSGLRTAQYLGGVDMWHDELALARNVEDRGLVELVTRPLEHHQVAPIGYLALLEISTRVLGVSEAGLRLAPWLLGLAALFLFWRVTVRFSRGPGLLVALALFAVSPALVWYGASVKPYGSDVAVSLLLVWLSLRHLERPRDLGRAVGTGAVGGVALLLSFPAVPTAAIAGLLLVAAWWRGPRGNPASLSLLGIGWAVGASLAGWSALSLLDPATNEFMRDFWAEDFPPSGRPLAAVVWIGTRFYGAFAHSLVFFPPSNPVLGFIVATPLILAAVGLVLGAKRGRSAVLLLAPVAAGIGAAVLGLLPFDQRLGLHATWPVLTFAALGIQGLTDVARNRRIWLARGLAVLTAAPLVAIVLLTARPPYGPSDEVTPRAVLGELAQSSLPGDRIYVYTQGRHDMAYYGRREGLDRWVQGDRHYEKPRGYLREIDELRGHPRVWFFWVRLDRDEPAWIRAYLETIGRESDRIPEGDLGTTGAVLYDLSNSERLGAASAESFPLPEEE